MKRYTIKAQSLSGNLTAAEVQRLVDKSLLSLSPRFLSRLYRVAPADSGDSFLVQVLSEASRASLHNALRPLLRSAALRIIAVGWGWPAGEMIQEEQTLPFLRKDPYSQTRVQEEDQKIYSFTGPPLSYALLILLTVLLILSIVLQLENSAVSLLTWSNDTAQVPMSTLFYNAARVCIFPLWLITAINLPGFALPSQWVVSAACTPKGLGLKFWALAAPKFFQWKDIQRLDVLGKCLIIYHDQKKLRLYLNDRKTNQAETLAKTIIHRANLNFVESEMGGRSTYMRFNAPD